MKVQGSFSVRYHDGKRWLAVEIHADGELFDALRSPGLLSEYASIHGEDTELLPFYLAGLKRIGGADGFKPGKMLSARVTVTTLEPVDREPPTEASIRAAAIQEQREISAGVRAGFAREDIESAIGPDEPAQRERVETYAPEELVELLSDLTNIV
jgi:hypothetical protein